MSYSALYIVNANGDIAYREEYSNSHGTAAMIWSAICRRYSRVLWPDAFMKNMDIGWMSDDGIWAKFNSLPLRWWEHNALRFTYDQMIVKAEDLELMAESLERFEDAHGVTGYVCHLPAIAKHMREIAREGTALGVCLYATSCGDNCWSGHEDDGSEFVRPYNINTDTGHDFIECRSKDPSDA